uniref:Uncharacterized protein n=1 Tax=Arundo donax TaxID=35708 RepID=A0A0A8Z349_ARUDO
MPTCQDLLSQRTNLPLSTNN